MALGRHLVDSLLANDLKKSEVKHVKGVYTTDRNYAIICRLYYHYKLKGLRYDTAIEMLSKEFFLGELRIAQIIMECRETLEKLKAENATKKHLGSKLPHFNWN